MTNAQLDELLAHCPTLYHMAERGSWPAISERGLLSTTALLDLYGVVGKPRTQIERKRRSTNVLLKHETLPDAVVRDQLPMDDTGLKRCLPSNISPSDWYQLLNSKVFFWLTRGRLVKLLKAGAYRDKIHDVIEVNTTPLVEAYRDKIWLCPMNSGCTKPYPHPRDTQTFQRIETYPYSTWATKRKPGERVVELAVDHGVPNIRDYVIRVLEMKGSDEIRRLA